MHKIKTLVNCFGFVTGTNCIPWTNCRNGICQIYLGIGLPLSLNGYGPLHDMADCGRQDDSGRFTLWPGVKVFLQAGVCGVYTTFSSFSLQTRALIQNGGIGRAPTSMLVSMVAGLLDEGISPVARPEQLSI